MIYKGYVDLCLKYLLFLMGNIKFIVLNNYLV